MHVSFTPLLCHAMQIGVKLMFKNGLQHTALCLSPGQIIAYLDCRSKGCSSPLYIINTNCLYVPHYNFMPDGLVHDTLLPEAFQTVTTIEGDVPPHLAMRSNTNIADKNKTTKHDKYPWQDKDDKRQNITD